jgi:ribulose-bisphosphate carboxylase small chain
MASIVAASTVVAPAAFAAASYAVTTSESNSVRAFSGLKSAALFASKGQTLSSVQNGSRVQCMQVWNPIGMTKFETFSYLPALTDDQIAKQVDYMIQQKLIPCLEFDLNSEGVSRENNSSPGYYDGRYWTMWKLPMFGCNDPAQVLREIEECKKEYPSCFVRVLGFDNVKQVQICGFLVARPN